MNEYLDYVLGQLEGLGEVAARKMFGGIGLYSDGFFFGLIARDVVYFKVDDSNRSDYEERGSEAFQPYADRPNTMSYYEVPVEVLEKPREVAEWAARSLEIARQQPERKRRKKAGKKAGKTRVAPLTELRNIGPKSAASLREAGVKSREDLERLGSVGAFRRVKKREGRSSLNLLYALEGALLDVRWDELPEPLKERLRLAAKE